MERREHSKGFLAIFAAFFIAVLIVVVYSIKIMLWPILVGFLFALIMDPLVDFIESKGMNRTLAISLLFVLMTILFTLFIVFCIPSIVKQVQKFIQESPAYVQLMKSQLDEMVHMLEGRWPKVDWRDYYEAGLDKAEEYGAGFSAAVPSMLNSAVGVIAYAVIVPFVTFFILMDGTEMKKQIVSLVPNRYFEMTLKLFYEVKQSIFSYIRGTIWDCSIIAALYVVGYGVIQVRYFFFLGLFAGCCNLVPYVGPWIAGGLATLVLFVDPNPAFPWWSAFVVVAIIQTIENNIVYPLVIGKSISIHPLVIMLGLFVGGEIAGLVGMIVSVPVMAVIKSISEILWNSFKKYSVI